MTGHPLSHYRDIIARICEQDDDEEDLEALDREKRRSDTIRKLPRDFLPHGVKLYHHDRDVYNRITLEWPAGHAEIDGVPLDAIGIYLRENGNVYVGPLRWPAWSSDGSGGVDWPTADDMKSLLMQVIGPDLGIVGVDDEPDWSDEYDGPWYKAHVAGGSVIDALSTSGGRRWLLAHPSLVTLRS